MSINHTGSAGGAHGIWGDAKFLCGEPTTEPRATATATVEPTSTATATVEPTATATATVEPTVTATATVEPTVTTSPTSTVKPTSTTKPTTTKPATPGDLYQTPGYHKSGGREWFTSCEPYSATQRCRTEIWSPQVTYDKGTFVKKTGWFFNNLTYLPAPKSLWVGNPLAHSGAWTSTEGRKWMTECNTAVTGGNGCRSYVWSNMVQASQHPSGTWSYALKDTWVFNNIVRFS